MTLHAAESDMLTFHVFNVKSANGMIDFSFHEGNVRE